MSEAGPKHVKPLGPVPVFNCAVILAPRDATGRVKARVGNLDGIEVDAASEREALQQIVARFKAEVGALHAAGQTIPWREPPQQPAAGEQQRLIAVHL